jgi:2-phosphosulfolactate phosphatase
MSDIEILRVDQATAAQARGVVIVIDVIRAFTVAGYAFARGATRLWLVRTIEEALALRAREPQALLAGEVQGRLIEGFDINNSPARMAKADVRGRLIIQRTGAGTQGAVLASHARHLLLCALTNARATAIYAQTLAASTDRVITLLPTGTPEDFAYGEEDPLCADYIEALLRGRGDTLDILDKGIERLHTSRRFELWEQGHIDFPFEDIAAVLDVDRFNFAMIGTRKEWQGITYVDVQAVDVDVKTR